MVGSMSSFRVRHHINRRDSTEQALQHLKLSTGAIWKLASHIKDLNKVLIPAVNAVAIMSASLNSAVTVNALE